MKRIWFASVLAIAAISVIAPSLSRNSDAQETSSPEKFAAAYLALGKAKEYEKVADLVIDDRFNNDRQAEMDAYRLLDKDVPELERYEIKEVKNSTEEKATVVAVLEFADGSVEQRPMHLVKQDSDWKLHIDGGDASDDADFKRIKQPDGR